MRMSHAHHEFESENVASPPPILATGEVHRLPGTTLQTVMHPGVYKIALACWVGLLTIFWVTFWVSANALFMVVIATGYAVVFFGVPFLMSRIGPKRPVDARSLSAFTQAPFGTINGTLRGGEALLQVIMVPLCLTIGGVAIAAIIFSARLAH